MREGLAILRDEVYRYLIDFFCIKGITSDSRIVKKSYIFITVKGQLSDGHFYIKEAIKKGANIIIGDQKLRKDDFYRSFIAEKGRSTTPEKRVLILNIRKIIRDKNITVLKEILKDKNEYIIYIQEYNTREIISFLSCMINNHPSRKMKLIGITGTNGKTTTSYMLESIFKQAGYNPGVIGTINYRYNNVIKKPKTTTPGPEELQQIMKEMHTNLVDIIIMEVSSHALDQERVLGCSFDSAVFTNLTRDHLDYHRNYNNYFKAKSKLFRLLENNFKVTRFGVVNYDDQYGRILRKKFRKSISIISYGAKRNNTKCDISFEVIKNTTNGLEIKISGKRDYVIKSNLIGIVNGYNLAASYSCALGFGIHPGIIKKGLESLNCIPGRMEKVSNKFPLKVFVDYAHTDNALLNVLNSLNKIRTGKITTVFGCGGERDRGKRPIMGRVAAEKSDRIIITSDNPRSENPNEIIKDIIKGIKGKYSSDVDIVENRGDAIKKAILEAGSDDIVLIAGKGHENYQVVGEKVFHFSDYNVAEKYLNVRFGK